MPVTTRITVLSCNVVADVLTLVNTNYVQNCLINTSARIAP